MPCNAGQGSGENLVMLRRHLAFCDKALHVSFWSENCDPLWPPCNPDWTVMNGWMEGAAASFDGGTPSGHVFTALHLCRVSASEIRTSKLQILHQSGCDEESMKNRRQVANGFQLNQSQFHIFNWNDCLTGIKNSAIIDLFNLVKKSSTFDCKYDCVAL